MVLLGLLIDYYRYLYRKTVFFPKIMDISLLFFWFFFIIPFNILPNNKIKSVKLYFDLIIISFVILISFISYLINRSRISPHLL